MFPVKGEVLQISRVASSWRQIRTFWLCEQVGTSNQLDGINSLVASTMKDKESFERSVRNDIEARVLSEENK